MVMDQFSAAEIFNTSVRDLPKPRLIQTRRNLLALLNGDAFYPLSTWPQDIQQIFWKKPIGDTDKFQLMMFFLDNGCVKHLITDWILTSQHAALQAATILVAMASEKKKLATELSAKVAIWRPKDISSKE